MLLVSMFVFFGCSNNPVDAISDTGEFLKIDPRLNQDFNGYYHFTVHKNNTQTLHRLSADTGTAGFLDYEKPRVTWESWDLKGNIKIWIYVDQFGREHQIPFLNDYTIARASSFPDEYGIVNQEMAPVASMIGDTTRITAEYVSQITGDRFIDEVYIILD